ncbi:MAG: hypothetical protein WC712_05175 [Candidatus Brocadiia bacterium]
MDARQQIPLRRNGPRKRTINVRVFRALVHRLWSKVPEAYKHGIKGGCVVTSNGRRDKNGFILGELDPFFGNFRVTIYYGSFRSVFPNASPTKLAREVRRTLLHEVYHFLEDNVSRNELVRFENEKIFREVFPEKYAKAVKSAARSIRVFRLFLYAFLIVLATTGLVLLALYLFGAL